MKNRFIRSVVGALVVTGLWAGLIVYLHLSGDMAPEAVRENYLSILYVFPSATAIFFAIGLYLAVYKAGGKAGEKVMRKVLGQEKNTQESDN